MLFLCDVSLVGVLIICLMLYFSPRSRNFILLTSLFCLEKSILKSPIIETSFPFVFPYLLGYLIQYLNNL